MMYALIALSVVSAPTFNYAQLDGTWRGHYDMQMSGTTCPAQQCNIPREVEMTFAGGELVWGKDRQLLETNDKGHAALKIQTEYAQKDGRTMTALWNYTFDFAPNGHLIAVMSYHFLYLRGDYVDDKGCTCAFATLLRPDH